MSKVNNKTIYELEIKDLYALCLTKRDTEKNISKVVSFWPFDLNKIENSKKPCIIYFKYFSNEHLTYEYYRKCSLITENNKYIIDYNIQKRMSTSSNLKNIKNITKELDPKIIKTLKELKCKPLTIFTKQYDIEKTNDNFLQLQLKK